jgi:hypothetical protein
LLANSSFVFDVRFQEPAQLDAAVCHVLTEYHCAHWSFSGRTPWRDCIFNVEYRALTTTETKHMSLAAAAASKNYRTAHFGKWRK